MHAKRACLKKSFLSFPKQPLQIVINSARAMHADLFLPSSSAFVPQLYWTVMSSSTQFSPVIQQLFRRKSNPSSISTFKAPRLVLLAPISLNCSRIHLDFKAKVQVLENHDGEVSVQDLDDSPASIELQPISDEPQFDRVIAEAQQLDESVVILWCVIAVHV